MRELRSLLYFVMVVFPFISNAQVSTDINDFFLPGSQPFQSSTFNPPNQCGCHQNYDKEVEPYFNWQGSMMAHAARDPLFYATLSVANQDALESGDLCIRCHSPTGWLEGRSTPTDGTALTSTDRESIFCDFCHRMVHPNSSVFNPYPTDIIYTENTYPLDSTYTSTLTPAPPTSANGMFVAHSDDTRRGPFSDPESTHKSIYSPFHSDAYLCGTCHDVSNPVYTKDINGKYQLNNLGEPSPNFDPYTMFPVERTFSEWKMSSYNSPSGVYAPEFGGNKDYVATCQDCHMRDVTGKGCSKNFAPVRDDLPLHDLTGGNTFIPKIIASVFPGEVDQESLDSGIVRATNLLQKAAKLEVPNNQIIQPDGKYLLTVRVTNETGHKLPSGYPEGRRIWINVKAYNSNQSLIFESGVYEENTATLIHDEQIKIYEIKPGISKTLASTLGTNAGPSFHFVLNDTIYSDNRIPPRGFTNSNFEAIQSPPIGYSYSDGQYWDDTEYLLPSETETYLITLYYQTTTKEYVEFLRDENVTDSWGTKMYDLWNSNGKSSPVVMEQINGVITPETVRASIKIFLEGAFLTSSDEMSTSLGLNPEFPLTQPYSAAPWYYPGSESLVSVPNNVVDWVLVELRDKNDFTVVRSTRAALVLNTGEVVDLDGISPILFNAIEDNYYITIIHRNHLQIMSKEPIFLGP